MTDLDDPTRASTLEKAYFGPSSDSQPVPWADIIGPGFAPQRRAGSAWVDVGQRVVITHNDVPHAMSADAVTAVLWESFDGSASLEQLGEDLSAALELDSLYAHTCVGQFARLLAMAGLLEEPRANYAERLTSYPGYPDADSCVGQKLGMGAASFVGVDTGDEPIRVGSTDTEILEWLIGRVGDRAMRTPFGELFSANVVQHKRAADRGLQAMHRLADGMGAIILTTADRAEVGTALGRTVGDRLRMVADGGTWFRMPVFARDGRAVIVFGGYEHEAFAATRRLRKSGVHRHFTTYVRYDATANTVDLKPDPTWIFSGTPPIELQDATEVVGVFGPASVGDDAERVRGFSHCAVTWDQGHLEATRALITSNRYIDIPERMPANDLVDSIRATLDG